MNLRIQKLQTDLMAANQVRDQLHTATQCTQHLCITKYFRWKQTTFPASAVHVSRCRKDNRSLCLSQRNNDQRHKTEHKFIYSLSLQWRRDRSVIILTDRQAASFLWQILLLLAERKEY